MQHPSWQQFGKHPYGYRRGTAFLAGPEHTPYDGNANYVCARHLDPEVNVFDPVTNERYGIDNSGEKPKRVAAFPRKRELL